MTPLSITKNKDFLVIDDKGPKTLVRVEKVEVFGTLQTGFMIITSSERLKFVSAEGRACVDRIEALLTGAD